MNRDALRDLFFDEHYAVRERVTTAHVVGVLESLCIRELAARCDQSRETVVGAAIACRHCGVVPAGARVRVTGWVDRVGARDDVTFWVYAQDEKEEVCQGTIVLTIVPRARLARILLRKTEAIARRVLFAPA
jgi:predicted thioesterase